MRRRTASCVQATPRLASPRVIRRFEKQGKARDIPMRCVVAWCPFLLALLLSSRRTTEKLKVLRSPKNRQPIGLQYRQQ